MLAKILETMCWQLALEEAPTTWREVARRLGVSVSQVERWRRGASIESSLLWELIARWNGVAKLHSIDLVDQDGRARVQVGPPIRGAEVVVLFG